jgi:hypothetical protein
MRLAEHVTRMGRKKYSYSLLVGKQKERDDLEDKMDLVEIGWCEDWSGSG